MLLRLQEAISTYRIPPMSLNRISLLASMAGIVFFLAACTTTPPHPKTEEPRPPAAASGPVFKPMNIEAIPGWGKDDLREAWPAFLTFCEAFFVPNQVLNPDGSDTGVVTGYYEPLLYGARKRGGRYQTPLYRAPDDMLTIDLVGVYPELRSLRLRGRMLGNKIIPYFSRAELTQSNLLAGKELLWVDDPIDAFFVQVQGSGRVQLLDTKETVRIAYADQNGYPYKSIGRYLIDKGELTLEQASAQGIKAWVSAHPHRLQELLNANPSYVFFKEEKLIDPKKGPKGALGVPLTPQRSIAVDPQFIPLGAPVFLATTQPASEMPLRQLMMAQDTGGAIRNAVRADFFWGFGKDAGERAGRMKQRGMMWVLLPKLVWSGAMVAPSKEFSP